MPRKARAGRRPAKGATAPRPAAGGKRAALRLDLVILVVALVVRLVFLAEHSRNPTFDQPIVDSQLYDATARGFVQTGNMGFGFFWQPFFYPLALSAVYAVSGGSMLAARLVQLAVGAVTCLLVYHLGRRIFDRRIGLVSGLITAVYGPLVFYDAELVGAGWAAFVAAALTLTLLWAQERQSLAACFLVGLCGAISIIIRPTFLGFFLIACVYLLVVLVRHQRRGLRILTRIGAGVIGFALVAIPVAVQCKTVAGYYSLLPAAGGLNMYIGNNPDAAYTLTVRPGEEWTELQNEAAYAGHQTPLARSQFFYGRVRDFVVTQPLAYVRGLLSKAAQFLCGREVPRNTDIYVFCEWSALLRVLVWKIGGFGFPWTPLVALVAVGLVFHWRQVPFLVKLFVLLLPAAIVLVFVADRYRIETVPVLAVLAAAGIVGIVRQFRGRMWSSALLGCGLALLVAVVTSLPKPRPEERINYASEMYVLLADSVHERSPRQAITWYEDALRRESDCQRAHSHLAAVLAGQQREREALEHFEQALRAEPSSPLGCALVYYERGKVRMEIRDLEGALADFDAVLAVHPRYAHALCRRGAVLYEMGRVAEATNDWRRALEVAVAEGDRRYARARLDRLSQTQSPTSEPTPPIEVR